MSKYFMDSDDEAAEERHFKLGKDKKWEALEKILDECKKHANISDFNAMDSDMPRLAAEIEKNAATLFKEKGDALPNRVLKIILLFEDTINDVTNAMKKKMTKANASAHNKIKQKLKKWLQSTGEGEWLYEKQLAKYRENPVDSEEEKKEEESDEEEEEEAEEEEDDSDEEAKAGAAGAAQEAAKEKGGDAAGDDEYGDYYDEEEDQDDGEVDADDEDVVVADSVEINPKLRKKYAFLWKQRDEMTASERRWKWVKKESLPSDLVELMAMLLGGKKKDKGAKGAERDGDDEKPKEQQEKEVKEEALTQIKRDYLSVDYHLFVNCQETLQALKEERLKTKYSAEYHALVLGKIFAEMPCQAPNEIRMKIEIIIYLVGTLFQTTRTTNFLSREQWITVHDRVRELLRLAQTPVFIKDLKEAHSSTVVPEQSTTEADPLTADDVLAELEKQNKFETERSVFPSLSTFLERMDENLWKSYQKLAGRSSSIDYLERINDENKLLFLIDETMELLQ